MSIKELNVNDYYFHSIIQGAKKAFEVIDGVIDKNGILPPKKIENCSRIGCNTSDEICLSHITNFKGNKDNYLSCFDIYVPRLMSFVIDKSFGFDYKIKKSPILSTAAVFKLVEKDNKKYTNLYDEYRTKNKIPFSYIKGLCFPYNDLLYNPMSFLTFIDEQSQVEFYNGYIYKDAIEYYNNALLYTGMEKRIEFMEKYIYSIKMLFEQKNVDLPIYFYEQNDTERKLVLK